MRAAAERAVVLSLGTSATPLRLDQENGHHSTDSSVDKEFS